MISSDLLGMPIHPASPFWVINENRQRIFDVNTSKGYSYLYEPNHVVLVKMYRSKAEQVPFGELLTKARLDAGLSRAQLAKETGVSENSLQRYEKAGIEDDGQYPPSPKMAKLCFHLGINPWMALFGSLEEHDFYEYRAHVVIHEASAHPDFNYMMDQYLQVLKDNDVLKSALKFAVGIEDGPHDEDVREYIISEAIRIASIHEKYTGLFKGNGRNPFEEFSIGGNPKYLPFKHANDYAGMRATYEGDEAELKKTGSSEQGYDNSLHGRMSLSDLDFIPVKKQSGPDRSDLDHSGNTTNEQAVDAASTETPRREDQ
tara:strand:- start:37981 stop:38928 length:948 start_codon:yes stop_codon:yes gene_type:complete